jgi:acyl-CoA synthetase (AMP-forming)/AMP-acid ligase II
MKPVEVSRPEDQACAGLLPVLQRCEDRVALRDGRSGRNWTRAELRQAALRVAARLECGKKKLVFLEASTRAGAVIGLLGAAAAGHAVALVDPALSAEKRVRLEALYRPNMTLRAVDDGDLVEIDVSAADDVESAAAIHDDVFLLLSTSGTTGSAKFVRLSHRSIEANARQISMALHIDENSVAIAHLPLHYSYGLSVVTSHLIAGGSVAVIDDAITSPGFWSKVADANGTHFPGVPFHYVTLARLGFSIVPASVKTFTQAGGSLDMRFQKIVAAEIEKRHAHFFVMYGQTEASPRMTTLPHDMWTEKPGSVGKALHGARLAILEEDGREAMSADVVGSVIFEGPNVMMGYAEGAPDLSLGDVQCGRLETGDIGRLDEDGYLYLVGREKRFAKIAGLRLSLDEIEREIARTVPVICLDAEDKIMVCFEGADPADLKGALRAIATEYKIPAATFKPHGLDAIPRKTSGKVDYVKLGDMIRVRSSS